MPTHTQDNGNHINPQIAVVMVPLPAQGHLNQLLHVARIISAAAIPVYYVGAATHIRQAKLRVHGWDDDVDPSAAVHFHEFSTPSFDNPPPNPNASDKFPSQLLPSLIASTHLRQPVHTFLTQLSTKFRRVVVISDSLMSYVVQDIESIPNAEAYCFRCISAFTVHAFHWDAVGRPDLPAEAAVMREIPRLDDLFPQEFSEFSRMQRGLRHVFSGELYNSGREIEGLYLDLLEKSEVAKIWAVGPLNPVSLKSKNDSRKRHKCLEWLDEQEPESVIFISFGTTTSLSDEQIRELAKGLESSQQRFLWVVRDADKGDIFADEEGRACELPAGFEERVRGRGMVVREWAPQVEVLGHPSTGGFVSHCGWNSCMESISNGVPIAAWPMHSDQPTNAVLVAEVLGVGVRVMEWVYRNEVVAAERIEKAVRKLMASGEGEEMRRKAKEFGSSLQMKGGGEMASFIAHITR